MLDSEIVEAQRFVRTDAYSMSIGELVSMYENEELIIDPEFQRLFRWDASQKSKLIESILLGIPIPSIFVFEKDDGSWELIDGLQRLSTILEFMGILRDPENGNRPPSILEATKYLPSLYNVVWESTDAITGVPEDQQNPLAKPQQLFVKRARIGVEILKRPSEDKTKFDLFQRLNAGGTQANAQELRNCIMLMINRDFFLAIKGTAERDPFLTVTGLSNEQREKQRHLELAVRFLVHASVPYDGKLDVEEYIDEGIVDLAKAGAPANAVSLIDRTFGLLNEAAGSDALRKYQDGQHRGAVGLVGLEAIAVGVAKNLDAIEALDNPSDFVLDKIQSFWQSPQVETFTSSGLRGTSRIQRTVSFGEQWFKPNE